MHDPSDPWVTAVDPAQQQLLDALERQAASLSVLRERVADARDHVPSSGYDGWRGLAAVAFDVALLAVRHDVATTMLCIEEALSETRHAVATLRGRV